MSGFYPAGSMRGSGIYSTAYTQHVECNGVRTYSLWAPNDSYQYEEETDCTFSGEVDVQVDDFKHAVWDCPECGKENEIDNDPSDYEPDYDPYDDPRNDPIDY